MKCSQCGKAPVSTNRVAVDRGYVNNRSKRRQKPNVSKRRLLVEGKVQTITICTRCVRTLTKETRR